MWCLLYLHRTTVSGSVNGAKRQIGFQAREGAGPDAIPNEAGGKPPDPQSIDQRVKRATRSACIEIATAW